MIFLGFAAFTSEMKKRDFFAKKSSHFLKMDILFLSFFSERAHFFFRFLFCVGQRIVGTFRCMMIEFDW